MAEHVALAILSLALLVTVTSGLRALASERRQAARERDLILNQLLHATGHTWTPPPADTKLAPVEDDPPRYLAAVERIPMTYE